MLSQQLVFPRSALPELTLLSGQQHPPSATPSESYLQQMTQAALQPSFVARFPLAPLHFHRSMAWNSYQRID